MHRKIRSMLKAARRSGATVCLISAAAAWGCAGGATGSRGLIGPLVAPSNPAAVALVNASGGAMSAEATAQFMAQRQKELDAALAPEIKAGQATVEHIAGKAIQVAMTGRTAFPPQSTVINPGFIPTLKTVAGVVTQNGKMTVTVIGYPDASGDAAPELLGYQRAEVVRVQLIGMGVKPILVSSTDNPGTPRDDGLVQIILTPLQSQ